MSLSPAAVLYDSGGTAIGTPTNPLVVATKTATSAVTSVGGSATNVTLLASNASRKGATIYNNSTAQLYMKLGATATTASFTAILPRNAYYEVPFGYTGIIDGIWTAAVGAALVTEIT